MLHFSPIYLVEFIQHENISDDAFYEQFLTPTEDLEHTAESVKSSPFGKVIEHCGK